MLPTWLGELESWLSQKGYVRRPIPFNQIQNYPGDSTKFARGDGTWATAAGISYRKTTAKTVNTTVAATDLLNGEITIAAGVMGTTGVLRVTASGDWINNSGGGVVPPRFQCKLGGTTIFDTGALATGINTSASRYKWSLRFTIANLGAANSQEVNVDGLVIENTRAAGASQTAFTTGSGYYTQNATSTFSSIQGGKTGLAIDTSVAAALVLNVINGSASASYETKLTSALVEII